MPNGDGNDLWNEMKLQRRLEFAFECPGFRYFDLLRWGEAEGKTTIEELNTPSRGLWIFRKGMEIEKAGENGYPVEPDGEGYFTPKFQTLRCRILIMKSLMMQDTTLYHFQSPC